MVRPGSGRALPLAVAALLAAAGIGLIAAHYLRPGTGPAAPADPCAERLVVYAPDATPLDVVARRCETSPGGSPALLVVTRDAARARDWRDALTAWADEGRTTWFLVIEEQGALAPASTGDETGVPADASSLEAAGTLDASGAIAAAASALTEEAGVDPGRVALLVDESLASGEGLDAGAAVVAAVVIHRPEPSEEGGPQQPDAAARRHRVSGPVRDAAAEVTAILAERLAIAPLAAGAGAPGDGG